MEDCGEKTGELNDIIWLLQKTCQSKLRKKQNIGKSTRLNKWSGEWNGKWNKGFRK